MLISDVFCVCWCFNSVMFQKDINKVLNCTVILCYWMVLCSWLVLPLVVHCGWHECRGVFFVCLLTACTPTRSWTSTSRVRWSVTWWTWLDSACLTSMTSYTVLMPHSPLQTWGQWRGIKGTSLPKTDLFSMYKWKTYGFCFKVSHWFYIHFRN